MASPRYDSGKPAHVILFGLGALGSLVVKCLAAGAPRIRIVGAVDRAPDKAGRRLGDLYPGLAGRAEEAETIVAGTLADCLAGLSEPADLVYHMTESVLDRIEPQLVAALSAGLCVVSASEAMFHPALRFAKVADRLDAAARRAGVSIVGVGINPGFSFDALPLMLARTTSDVRSVSISRIIDVTGTGPGDIEHVGYGLTPEAFDAGIASGRIVGHMGTPESIALMAERLGMEIDAVEESWATATASFPVDSGTQELGILPPGRVIGITQEGRGLAGGRVAISMKLVMYYRPEDHGLTPSDAIVIDGAHRLQAEIKPAAASLFGAANTIVNATHDTLLAPSGLVNVLDFSIAGDRRGGFRYVIDPERPPVPGRVALRRTALA